MVELGVHVFLFGFDSRGVPCSPFLALKVPVMQVTGCGFTKDNKS